MTLMFFFSFAQLKSLKFLDLKVGQAEFFFEIFDIDSSGVLFTLSQRGTFAYFMFLIYIIFY